MRVPFWVVLAAAAVIFGAAIFTRTIPYWVVLSFVVGWLVSEYVSAPTASERCKRIVVLVTVWATATASTLPVAVVPAILALVGVGVYVILHREVTDHIEKTESERLPRE